MSQYSQYINDVTKCVTLARKADLHSMLSQKQLLTAACLLLQAHCQSFRPDDTLFKPGLLIMSYVQDPRRGAFPSVINIYWASRTVA